MQTNTVIIGASAAGLATAACLKRENIPFILLERSDCVGMAWRNHYERLHLHTNKRLSGLPYFPMPDDVPQYAPREQVIQYLEDYTAHHGIKPHFNEEVTAVMQHTDGTWITETSSTRYESQNVVVATGYTHTPNRPTWPGLDRFKGTVIHSSQYKNGTPFKGQDVLVVGFGNSGGEIAIDLYEHGARPAVAVRSAVNVIPRDILGIPILGVGILMDFLSPKVADMLAAPLLRLFIGNIERYGLRQLPYGPNVQIRQDGQIPLLDIGTMKLIRQGHIRVQGGLERLTEQTVIFADGTEKPFDALVLATGYHPNLSSFLKPLEAIADESGVPLVSGSQTALKGLYFCGFYISPTGMLREIGIEAKKIAQLIITQPIKER